MRVFGVRFFNASAMNRLSWCVLLFVPGLLLGKAQTQPTQTAKENDVGTSDLSLKTKVLGQKYCYPDSVGSSMYIDLGLRFTNVSDHPVILSRKIESPDVVRVAGSVEAAKKEDYDYDPHGFSVVQELPAAPRFGKSPDPKHFVILPPGASYETTVPSGVLGVINPSPAEKVRGLSSGNSYVLQVRVGTWPYQWPYFESAADVRKLADRWGTYGRLAYGTVYSDFTPFSVPKEFKNPPCK
jgi:hypothetical protein